jgi:Resolvase, N terminal domain
MKASWIIADKEGIRKNLGTRGFSFVLNEMVQNAIDENITKVEIDLPRASNRRSA